MGLDGRADKIWDWMGRFTKHGNGWEGLQIMGGLAKIWDWMGGFIKHGIRLEGYMGLDGKVYERWEWLITMGLDGRVCKI